MVFELENSIVTPEDLRTDSRLAEAADKEYVLNKSGPRTIIPSSVAYLPFSHFMPEDKLKALGSGILESSTDTSTPADKILVERLSSDKRLGQIEFYFDVSMYSPYFKSLPGKKYGTMLMMLQYPFTKGSIHIPAMRDGKKVTSDDKPVIDPKYYQGPGGEVDFKVMVASQKFANKICQIKPLSNIIVERVYPPAEAEGEDDDFSDWVRDSTITDWHPVGTSAMGGRKAEDGYVIDERLRVYGVKGLRVCDASIMPLQISAHLQATVYAIGEKGASLILEDWEKMHSTNDVH